MLTGNNKTISAVIADLVNSFSKNMTDKRAPGKTHWQDREFLEPWNQYVVCCRIRGVLTFWECLNLFRNPSKLYPLASPEGFWIPNALHSCESKPTVCMLPMRYHACLRSCMRTWWHVFCQAGRAVNAKFTNSTMPQAAGAVGALSYPRRYLELQ